MERSNDLCDKEELRNVAFQELRKLGFKNILKQKKTRQKVEEVKKNGVRNKLFHVELHALAPKVVDLNSGVSIEVPAFVADACAIIEKSVSTEGLFRKAGSNARQKEIKASLEAGKELSQEYHVIDVANTLKLFFRELPEPLIPFCCHEAFLRCLKMKDKMIECLLMCCLLLPLDHLNTLIYFVQFLHKVSDNAEKNKMDINNLSIIMAPTLMPVEGRITENISLKGSRLNNHVRVIELLIKNSHLLGELPENLLKKLPAHVDVSKVAYRVSRADQADGVKKKRRSESMTRVLSGFRRMVRKPPTPSKGSSNSTSFESLDSSTSFQTPVKKRKAIESSASFRISKQQDVPMTVTPRSFLPNTARFSFPQDIMMPYNACGLYTSPKVCFHPNLSPNVHGGQGCDCGDQGKKTENECNGVGKKKKTEDSLLSSVSKSKISKAQFNPVRRWSSLASSSRNNKDTKKVDAANGISPRKESNSALRKVLLTEYSKSNKQRAENDCDCHGMGDEENKLVLHPEPVKKSHSGSFLMATLEEEYQVIKNKVSAIENQLMEEFGRLGATSEGSVYSVPSSNIKESNDTDSKQSKGLDSVQTKYEKTLEDTERLGDSSADQLAKRLSRELKIRWSAEHKIIRSPSARKIGSLRRRSRDSVKHQKTLSSSDSSSQSACDSAVINNTHKQELVNGSGHSRTNHISLKRGRPNTIQTGLRHPSPGHNSDGEGCLTRSHFPLNNELSVHLRAGKSVSSPQLNRQYDFPETVPPSSSVSLSNRDIETPCTASESKKRENNTFDFHSPQFSRLRTSKESGHTRVTVTSTPGQVKRASSFQEQMETSRANILLNTPNDLKKCESYDNVSRANISDPMGNFSSGSVGMKWQPAVCFLSDPRLYEQPVTGRESVAKLRAQNAGKVQANVKLFENNGKIRDGHASRLSGASCSISNQNLNVNHRLNRNVSGADCDGRGVGQRLLTSSTSTAKCSHRDRTKPRRSSSDSASHIARQVDLRRHHGRLSAPGSGKPNCRKHKSFSPFGQKGNFYNSYSEQSKENLKDPLQILTETLVKEYDNLKETHSSCVYNALDKLKHINASPLKDTNRQLSNREAPAINSPVVTIFPGGSVAYSSSDCGSKILQTPIFDPSPVIKQPLTSGHKSLRPVSSLRKRIGKISPIKGIHALPGDVTPKLSTKRQSPRLLLRSRLMSSACM